MQIGAQTRGAAASGSPASCGTARQLDAPSGAGGTEPRSLVRVGLGLSTGPGNPEGCRSPASDAGRTAPGARPAQGERLVLSDPPPIVPSQAPARIPHTLPPGPARACSTRVSTCPVRKNSSGSLSALPSRLTIARSPASQIPTFPASCFRLPHPALSGAPKTPGDLGAAPGAQWGLALPYRPSPAQKGVSGRC